MIYSYRRVSTDEQHNGPQAQKDTIDRWLLLHNRGAVVSSHDFFDNGVSGSIPLAERPEGGKLCDLLEQDPEPTIVVAKLDRLFRSVADAVLTLAGWDKTGVKLVSIAEGFDMTSPYGRAMAQMASVFAELERAMIKQRTKDALQVKKARGEWCGGNVPYGHRISDCGAIVEDPVEQSVLKNIVFLMSAGLSGGKVAEKLNANGVTGRGGKPWDRNTICKIYSRIPTA